MTEQDYAKLTKPYRENPFLYKVLKMINTIPTLLGYISYPVLILMLWITQDSRKITYLIFPALYFVVFSWIRAKLNYSRPYELLNIKPLIKKDKEGQSFPSRHVFSIFLISMLWLSVNLIVGIILIVGSILLAYARVVGGIHFPKDVVVGAIIGILCGLFVIII